MDRSRTTHVRANGFAMVELLVVMFILTTIAAIGVPAYLNQVDKAHDTEAKESARAAEAAATEISAENGGRFNGPNGVTVANLREADQSLVEVELSIFSVHPESYSVGVRSESGSIFEVTHNPDGSVELTCVTANSAGCPADGAWD